MAVSDRTILYSNVTHRCSSFHACRYPAKPSDTAHKFDPAKHNHVVFIRKNRFFLVPLATKDGREVSAADLEAQIERIIAEVGDQNGIPIGALTSENRDIWTEVSSVLAYCSE